ncbi:cytoplasmic tRNA 2-thiolation protein 2 [Gigaspora margarita]|uniref:Cytoplasmic tRNA 2-thiolation protein 2 n=1 Tax=Gigaspora margarita TaxID=4874 RepID=A0A8H4A8S0_GIGMA|nr:cytoplasmic tRNA 2-thiolation protein 2 [Gigaspora margarita]
MCSIEDTPNEVDAVKIKPINKKCIKCKSTPTILIRHSTYCKQCFQHAFVGKFRKNMDKLRSANSQGEKVLVGFSGGPSSRAMLQLLSDYNEVLPNERSKKPLFSEVLVCHIDESPIFNLDDSDDHDVILNQIEQIAQNYNYPFIGLRIEDIYSPDYTSSGAYNKVLEVTLDKSSLQEIDELNAKICQQETSTKKKLHLLLDGVSKLTAKEDLVWHLKQCLLINTARKNGCTKLLLGDCSTRLSIKIISFTSKGRGFSLPLDISGLNPWFGDVTILRPMKDTLSKEIGIYNKFQGFETTIIKSLTTMMPPKASIDRLTEEFVVKLERDFPSTVSTISRTAAKLTPSELIDSDNHCVICLMPFQKDNKIWQSRITVMTTPSSSTMIKTQDSTSEYSSKNSSTCSRTATCCSSDCCTSKDHNINNLTDLLCYACRVNMRDIKGITLPPYVTEDVEKRNGRENLKKSIEEYFLDDDD